MSAPLTVNTTDGLCWTRREVTRDGRELYALEAVADCPAYLMETYAELVERGISGSADVLLVPVSSQSSGRDRLRVAFVEALDNAARTHPCPVLGDQLWSGCVHYDEAGRIVGVGSCHSERRADAVLAVRDVEMERLRSQVTELNESVSSAAEESSSGGFPPALPWLALLDEDDRVEFLDELADSATVNASSDVRLAEVERTCGTWRLIAEERHGHNTAAGLVDEDDCTCPPSDRPEPHEVDCPLVDAPCPVDGPLPGVGPGAPEMRALRAGLTGSPERPVNELTAVFMPVPSLRASLEDPHDGPLARSFRLSHDLDMPEAGGPR